MASGSFTVTTSNGYISGKVNWSSTENVAGNYSDVAVDMRLSRENSGYSTYGTGDFWVVVNGTTVRADNKGFTLTYNSNTLMVSGTVRVTHNSDGKKAITISWDGDSDVFNVNAGSGTATLDTIPRASTQTTDANWTAGSNKAVSISRMSSSFDHTVKMYVNGVLVKTATNIGTSVTMTFNQTENTAVFNQLNGAATQDTKIEILTYDGSTLIGTTSKTGTVTAPYASNVSTINGTGTNGRDVFIDQATIDIDLTTRDSEFTHTLVITAGSGAFSKTITGVGSGGYTWTPTQAEKDTLYAAAANVNSLDGDIAVTTYYNGEIVRTATANDINFNVRNSNPTFTAAGVTYADTNATTTAITGNNQSIIQGKSNVKVTIPLAQRALPVNKSTMTKYDVTLNGVTKSANWSGTADVVIDFGIVNANSDLTLTITAIDSRGNTTTQTKTVTVLPYTIPAQNAKAARVNGFENSTVLSVNGTISPLMVNGVQKNNVAGGGVEYRYMESASGTWSAWTDFAFTTSGTNFTATNVTLDLDNLKAWDVEIRTTDSVGSTTTTAFKIGTGQPIFFIDTLLKSMGFNRFPEGAETFEMGGRFPSLAFINSLGNKMYITQYDDKISVRNGANSTDNEIFSINADNYLHFDARAGERRLAFNAGTGGEIGIYASPTNEGRFGLYDWGSTKYLMYYERSTDELNIYPKVNMINQPYMYSGSTTDQSIPLSAWTALTLPTPSVNVGGWAYSANSFTIPEDGVYAIYGECLFGATVAGKSYYLSVFLNGVHYDWFRLAFAQASGTGDGFLIGSLIHKFAQGDKIELRVYQSGIANAVVSHRYFRAAKI